MSTAPKYSNFTRAVISGSIGAPGIYQNGMERTKLRSQLIFIIIRRIVTICDQDDSGGLAIALTVSSDKKLHSTLVLFTHVYRGTCDILQYFVRVGIHPDPRTLGTNEDNEVTRFPGSQKV